MNKELELDIVRRAPKFWRFYRNEDSKRTNNMWFGMSCGDKWHDLLADMSDIINDLDLPDAYYAVQCKSKFGGLRVYVSEGNDDLYRVIRIAESRACDICEHCGNNPREGTHGWRDCGGTP